jgi:CRISPR-associated endonuclease/helicase Cas3
MAVPYTSIIEQTAKVYKYGTDDDKKMQENIRTGKVLFGEENVLEHHSNIDPEKELYKHALASQNWDAPIIVTTNVQLLQSLHASKTSSCRKLHNIANSVIIFDEAQMLPAQYLEPVIATLKGLVKSFGVTVLFCTATQPALTGKIGSVVNAFAGIDGCREIIDDPASLMDELRRVDYSVAPADLNGTLQWTDVAEELKKERQALCIVNTRKDCRDLHALMPEGTIHLSGFMCGEEISGIISDIKTRLRNNEEIRVISTQLVECGVDLNFPVVWRALAGIDSITQAAGRCNREGTLEGKGRVVVFVPPSAAPPGDIKIGSQVARSMLSGFSLGDATPQTFSEYFRQFYASQKNLDKPDFKDLLVKEALQGRFMFRTFAEQFKIIDDTRQRSVIVPYEGGKNSGLALIEELRRFGPTRVLMAKLQRFTVNVPTGMFDELCSSGAVENVAGYFVLAGSFYQKGKGVVTGNHSWKPEDYIV